MNASLPENFELIVCPVCSSEKFNNVITLTPSQFSGEDRSYYNFDVIGCKSDSRLSYVRCLKCSFVFVNPRLKKEYNNLVYNEAKVEQSLGKDWAFDNSDLSKLYNTYHKWKEVDSFLIALSLYSKRFKKAKNEGEKAIKLLDYGSGYGHTLDLCKVFSVEGYGVDIDSERIKYCNLKTLNVGRPEDLEQGFFDVVISNSVVEHVIDLAEYFEYISSRLTKGGIFIFNGLSPSVIDIEKKRGRYKNVHPIEHLSLFTKSSLIRMTANFGFSPVSRSVLLKAMLNTPIKASLLFPFYLCHSMVFRKGGFTAIMEKT